MILSDFSSTLPQRCKPFSELFQQIQNGKFKPITQSMWATIKVDGYHEEVGLNKMQYYESLRLKIPSLDANELKNLERNTIEKYNTFDICLKDMFLKNGKLTHIDYIDYNKGTITIVRPIK